LYVIKKPRVIVTDDFIGETATVRVART